MITYQSSKQLKIDEFKSDFELKLDKTNRWVKLSMELPWDEMAAVYMQSLDIKKGSPSVDVRVALGALIIKHLVKLSDEDTITHIQENPYMQYFLGLNYFTNDKVFSPSLFPSIRKRLKVAGFDKMTKALMKEVTKIEGEKDVETPEVIKNKGKLQLDATVADQYIKYPTDLDLLNQCREWSETIIDDIYQKDNALLKKPRTYRRIARRNYLNMAKKKRKGAKEIRKAIKQQLSYINRNFGYIEKMLDEFSGDFFPLNKRLQQKYWVIQEVFRQQEYMYKNKVHKCDHRIISIHQPHVRPIVRGKQGKSCEFGAKIHLSLEKGIARIVRHSWENYNESCDLQAEIEAYKSLRGYYPELVLVDKIYATRENRRYLKERNIRITAPPLGRKKARGESPEGKKKRKKENAERNHVEGKFGQAKNGYGMNKIRAKLASTSESWVGAIVFVMNIVKVVGFG